jgi:hypothetical protein
MRLKKNMSNPRMQSLLQAKPARHLTSVAGQRHGHGYCVFYNLTPPNGDPPQKSPSPQKKSEKISKNFKQNSEGGKFQFSIFHLVLP